jgi:hypothetical protein
MRPRPFPHSCSPPASAPHAMPPDAAKTLHGLFDAG